MGILNTIASLPHIHYFQSHQHCSGGMNIVPVFLPCRNILILVLQRDVCMEIYFYTMIWNLSCGELKCYRCHCFCYSLVVVCYFYLTLEIPSGVQCFPQVSKCECVIVSFLLVLVDDP